MRLTQHALEGQDTESSGNVSEVLEAGNLNRWFAAFESFSLFR